MSTDRKPFSWHSLAVALGICALLVLGVTSIALFLAPNCAMARVTGWTFLGLSKDSWEALSTGFGFLALLLGMFYLFMNWRWVANFFTAGGTRFSREAGVAVVISIICVVGSIGDVGPFAAVMRWHEVHKHERTAGAAPLAHAGGNHAGEHADCGGAGCGGGSCGDHGAEHASQHAGCGEHDSGQSCGSGGCGGHGTEHAGQHSGCEQRGSGHSGKDGGCGDHGSRHGDRCAHSGSADKDRTCSHGGSSCSGGEGCSQRNEP